MTSEPTLFRDLGVFSDDVFTSTQLNRHASDVLNRARTRPVTIARNNEQFALLRREQAAELITAVVQLGEAVKLFLGVAALKEGKEPSPSVAWVRAFDEDERVLMLTEMFAACRRASEDGDWESVRDIIHEWHESALVVQSGVLRDAMESEVDEQPLSRPIIPESGK